MSERPLHEHRTDGCIDVFKQPDGHYEIHTPEGETFVGGALNIAGRAAALEADTEMHFGGGKPEIIIRIHEDGRLADYDLLSVSFTTEAGL